VILDIDVGNYIKPELDGDFARLTSIGAESIQLLAFSSNNCYSVLVGFLMRNAKKQ
jgi:hypothetical protein